jgi:hypothetical protein
LGHATEATTWSRISSKSIVADYEFKISFAGSKQTLVNGAMDNCFSAAIRCDCVVSTIVAFSPRSSRICSFSFPSSCSRFVMSYFASNSSPRAAPSDRQPPAGPPRPSHCGLPSLPADRRHLIRPDGSDSSPPPVRARSAPVAQSSALPPPAAPATFLRSCRCFFATVSIAPHSPLSCESRSAFPRSCASASWQSTAKETEPRREGRRNAMSR